MTKPTDKSSIPATYIDGTPFPGKIGRSYLDPDCKPSFPVEQPAPAGAPNVLYIVLDDVGYGWSSTFGGLVQTPNITKLADAGLRYTNFHTTSICAPTRACLLTGRNHHSAGMGILPEMVSGYPGYNANLPRDKAAIGAMLRKAGYNTFAVGKWHNTPMNQVGPQGPYDRWPTGELYGFERFYGFMESEMDHYYPELYRDTHPVDPPAVPDAEGKGYHLSEDLVDNAIAMIQCQQSAQGEDGVKKPWLMYLGFGACHAPHHVTDQWTQPYADTFKIGWDKYRQRVLENQKKMGLLPATAQLPPMPTEIKPWDGLDADSKNLFARMAQVYAGFLAHTDAQIGRVIDYLRDSGQLDNTLVFVFVGDNGSSGEGTPSGLFNEIAMANKDFTFESVSANVKRIDRFGKPLSYNHYPVGWAFAGNTPFRLCKQYTHFGGIRNPMVVHWPKGIKAQGGIRAQFHHVIDVVPTILESIPGLAAPRELNGVTQAPIEGTSMKYSFDDVKAEGKHPTQYFEMMGNRAIVRQGWKAVTWHGQRMPWAELPEESQGHFEADQWELYALTKSELHGKTKSFGYEADPTESNDLARKITDKSTDKDEAKALAAKLEELVTSWWEEAGRYDVLPLDDRFQSRMVAPLPMPKQYIFRAGTTRIPEGTWPSIANRSWSIVAAVEVGQGAEGLICSQGGCTGGWALYMKEGVPWFCYNYLGEQLTFLSYPSALDPGKHQIRLIFERDPAAANQLGAGGQARLSADAGPVVNGKIPKTANVLIGTFDVGCEKGSPVAPIEDVKLLVPFTGKISQVSMDLKDDLVQGAAEARLAGMLARQ